MSEENTPLKTIENLYDEISQVIDDARKEVYHTANFAMVKAYWQIGKLITEEQGGEKRAEYGESLLDELSQKLTQTYGKSFSNRNLRHIRQFYRVFPKWNAVRSELSWTHYRLLIRVEDDRARQFYMQESIESNWSTRSLERK